MNIKEYLYDVLLMTGLNDYLINKLSTQLFYDILEGPNETSEMK